MMRMAMAAIVPTVLLATAASAQDAAVRALVDRFEAARLGYDPVALAATLAPEYEEISPIGDVDRREQVLGFYAPALKKPVPAMTRDQQVVRVIGDAALQTERRSFTPPGATAPRAIRIRYVARRSGRGWLLVSTQYTPMPSVRVR